MSSLPRRCPRCLYSLRGLPREHCCPECGQEYDALTRAWRPRVPWAWYVPLMVVCGVALYKLIQAFTDTLRNGQWPIAASFGMVMVCVVIYGMVDHILGVRTKQRFLAITPRGILSRTSVGGEHLITWNEIPDYAADELPHEHRVWLSRWSNEIFPNGDDDVAAFSEAVNEARKHYGKNSGLEP